MEQIRYFHTTGNRDLTEHMVDMPICTDDTILIKTIMTGICRSDIGAYAGFEEPMPFLKQGHEGTGEVVEVGKNITDVKVGDIVSTWSDPAYADYYLAKQNEFVVIPEASPKYILQPAACAINIANKTLGMMEAMGYEDEEILLLGSGFMSVVIGQYFKIFDYKFTVVGSSNRDHWHNVATLHKLDDIIASGKRYKVIIDLTSKGSNFHIIGEKLADLEALICYAATPYDPVTTNFFTNCWNCHTLIMPSPRNTDFNEQMALTRDFIKTGIIDTQFIWTMGYDRNNLDEVKKGFEDGLNRHSYYVRGYIKW